MVDLRETGDGSRDPLGTHHHGSVISRRSVRLLFDTLVHIQDVAVPLGLSVTMPLDAAREGVQRVWRMGWPFWARRRMRGVQLAATDVDWTAGRGAEIRGPVQALLLLITGRTEAALPHLAGPGLGRLAGLNRGRRRQARRAGRSA